MSSSVDRSYSESNVAERRRVRRGEILRHPLYTRILHWLVALTFILALLSGFAIYSPWLYTWLTPLFGGGPMTRFLHPWFSLAFTIAFTFQFFNWVGLMRWTRADSRWVRRMKGYVTNREQREPADTGFFNGGQKLYFWLIVFSALTFFITGLFLWFDHVVPRWLVAVSYVLHDLAGLLMLAGFIIHIYEGTAAAPGTFQSMVDGTVTPEWAATHHPGWYSSQPDEKRAADSAGKHKSEPR